MGRLPTNRLIIFAMYNDAGFIFSVADRLFLEMTEKNKYYKTPSCIGQCPKR